MSGRDRGRDILTLQRVYKLTFLIGFEYFHPKPLSKVLYLYTNLGYSLYAFVESKLSAYIMNNLVHVYVLNCPN